MAAQRSLTATKGLDIHIVHHKAANRDVSLAFIYLGERNYDAATQFLWAVDSDLKKLAEMPGLGAVREFQHPKLVNLRSWALSGFRNYLIFYRINGDNLEFMRLIHASRDIESVLLSP